MANGNGIHYDCELSLFADKARFHGQAFPGIQAAIIDGNGNELPAGQHGLLALKPGWPSMLRKVWGDEKRFEEYFSINGWYATGDTPIRTMMVTSGLWEGQMM